MENDIFDSVKTNYNDVYNEALLYNNRLQPDDKRFIKDTVMVMNDGAMFRWPNAFTMKRKDIWYLVFTENYGFHIFEADEVNFVEETYPSYDEFEEF